jgi:hypothetical protein
MATKKLIYSLFITFVFLSSCQKDIEVFVPNPGQLAGPDSTWYNTITNTLPVVALKNKLLNNIHKDSFVLNNNAVTLTTALGLQCTFVPGTLINTNNVPVTGKIYLETHLLRKKGDLIKMGKPTASIDRMLVSGGAYFIKLYTDSSVLQLSQNGHMYVRYNDPPVSVFMRVFNGVETNTGSFTWLQSLDTLNNRVTVLNQSYEILFNRLGWISCDYFYDTTSAPRTTVSAVLPSYFTNANSVAYTVFNDMRSVIGMYGNAITRKFSTGKLPSNKPITVIIISKLGDDYYLGHEQTLTVSPSAGTIGNQMVNVMPVKTSLDNIKAYLDGL